MLIRTSDLIGPALDWAVEALEIARMRAAGEHVKEWWVAERQTDPSPYSGDWLLAGPIIEREEIDLNCSNHEGDSGEVWDAACEVRKVLGGPTPLIAAMRAYVASRLGDDVEVPDELMEKPR